MGIFRDESSQSFVSLAAWRFQSLSPACSVPNMENKLQSYNTTQRVITNNGNIKPVLGDIPRQHQIINFLCKKDHLDSVCRPCQQFDLFCPRYNDFYFLYFRPLSPAEREVAVSLHTIISCLASHLPPSISTVIIISTKM